MKRSTQLHLFLFAGLLLLAFPIYSESKKEVKESAKEHVKKLDDDVKLSSEQRAKLEAASELFFNRLEEVRKIEDPDLRFQSQSYAFGAYEQAVDSMLNSDQKELRVKKIKEREEKDKAKVLNTK